MHTILYMLYEQILMLIIS